MFFSEFKKLSLTEWRAKFRKSERRVSQRFSLKKNNASYAWWWLPWGCELAGRLWWKDNMSPKGGDQSDKHDETH